MESFDPFEVLGLARRYEVDRAEVERAYLQRSAEIHPDLQSDLGLDGEETGEGVAELNRARQVLSDPEKRAVALWKLLGGVEDKGLSPGFLMEMMEVREQIEQATGSGGAGEIAKWEAWADERREEYQRKVGRLFEGVPRNAPPAPAILKQIKLELNAWRYIERLIEQLGES